MSAAGTLLFAAELDRMNELCGGRKLITCTYPRNVVVAQVLQHVGVFAMLRQRRTCAITADNVRFWKVDSGKLVDGERADAAIAAYGEWFPDPKRQKLYRGLSEAMTNSRHHAYKEERGDGLPNVEKWWMFSEMKDGHLTVAICDLGIGIPRSLQRQESPWWEKILDVLRSRNLPPDAGNMIRAAFELGRSSTGDRHRGKGLMDIRSVLDGLQGTLQIHSDSGAYTFDAEAGAETCNSYKTSIGGTLIIWKVPLNLPQRK